MKKYVIILVGLLLTSTGFSKSLGQFPNQMLKDISGFKVQTKDLYSKGPILVNFWNLACEPCKKEMKYLSEYNKKYGDQGFNVISINIDNTRSMSKVKSFVKSQKYSFRVLSDPKSVLFRKLGGKIMPYVLFINNDGTIAKKEVGYNPGDEIKLEKEIIHLIAENKKSLDLKEPKIESKVQSKVKLQTK